MDNNVTAIIIALITMVTTLTTAALAWSTHKCTKRLAETNKQMALGIARIGERSTDHGSNMANRHITSRMQEL